MSKNNNNNNLLDLNEQKKLFDRYSINTLESLELIYEIIGEDTPIGFDIIFNKKYEENRDNYEGRNEYTYGTRLHNFDMSEIMDSLDDLSDQEFAYLTNPLFKALSVIKEDQPEAVLIPKIFAYKMAQEKSLNNRFTPVYKGMLLKDIKSFFFKFSTAALENFDNILDYTNHERLNDIKRVKDEAYDSNIRKYKNNPVTSLSNISCFKFPMFAGCIERLTDLELDFFHDLVETASMYLDCIQDYSDYYKEEIEDFNLADYPVKEMRELLNTIEKEYDRRILLKAPSNEKEKIK